MDSTILIVFAIVGIVLILLMMLFSAIRVVQQYERGVIFVLGRLIGAKGPGIFLVPPFVSRMAKVDLRIVTLTVPPQEVITRDNVTVKVTAVIYGRRGQKAPVIHARDDWPLLPGFLARRRFRSRKRIAVERVFARTSYTQTYLLAISFIWAYLSQTI